MHVKMDTEYAGDDYMFRVEDHKDITDEEFDSIVVPHDNVCHDFLEQEVIPLYCAYRFKVGYEMNAMWAYSYSTMIRDALDVFNELNIDIDIVKKRTTEILKDKYEYEVINEDPLDLKKL